MKPPPNSPPTPPSSSAPSPDPNANAAPRGVPFDPGALSGSADDSKPKWSLAWIALAVVLVAWIAFMAIYNLGAHSQRPMPLGPIKSQSSPVATVSVDVSGAVTRPGVYQLRTDARVSDALAAAGGALPEADQSTLNLAAFVQDGAKISVPLRVATASVTTAAPASVAPLVTLPPPLPAQPGAPSAGTAPAVVASETASPGTLTAAQVARTATANTLLANPIDLNTATGEQLQQLPGVGPAMANRILEYRAMHGRFNSVADLDNVKGIGQKRMQEFQDMVVVR